MKTIINFLSDSINTPSMGEDVQINSRDIEKINKTFCDSQQLGEPESLRMIPKFQQFQIWLVKSMYFDYLGIERITDHPFLVILESDPETINGEEFVRVNPISPFVEMYSQQEVICNDPEVIGFPFMIESWNSQPILVELLDKYLGYFEYQNIPTENVSISPDLLEFRKIEISRASFLNNSIRSFLRFFETYAESDKKVFVSFEGKAIVPSPVNYQFNEERIFLQAAKSGKTNELQIMNYEIREFNFGVNIAFTTQGYVVSIVSSIAHKFTNSRNETLIPVKKSDRLVYSQIKKDTYHLYLESTKLPIVIRMK